MSKIKTFGEIQYYLYDGDTKEKNVDKSIFMKSKDVAVHHNTTIKKRKTTTSETGKIIEKFELFCEENGPNLTIDYNKEYDFTTNQNPSFDGGDGPSATSKATKYKSTKIKSKIDRGYKEDIERKEKEKKNSKEWRKSKMRDEPATDDKHRFTLDMMPRLKNSN